MTNKFFLIFIITIISFKIYGQKTKLIFVQSLKVNYAENPVDSNKPFSFKLLKNKKCILKNYRTDTLHHFSFELDTLTAISFEFCSDTILIPNAYDFFENNVFGSMVLIPNIKTTCILVEFRSYTDPYLTCQSISSNDKEFNNTSCNEYKYFLTEFIEQNLNYAKHLKSYIKLN